jgi:hypothetical protein
LANQISTSAFPKKQDRAMSQAVLDVAQEPALNMFSVSYKNAHGAAANKN